MAKSQTARAEGLAEWQAHWPLVLTACIGMSITVVHIYSFGVFLNPIMAETGWTRTELTLGQTMQAVISAVSAPITGVLMDRFGARKIVIPGLIIFSSALALFATIGSSLAQYYAVWLLISFGLIGLKPNIWCGSVSTRFTASRGLAFAVAISGSSVGVIFVPTLANLLMENFGWRGAYVGLAMIWIALTFPLAYVFMRTPLDDRANRTKAQKKADASTDPVIEGMTVKDALRSPVFVRLAITGLIFNAAMVAIVFNFVPMMIDLKISTGHAAMIAGLVGITAIVGRLVTGALLDRYHGALIGGIAIMLPIIPVTIMLMFGGSVPVAILTALLLGFASGSELDLLAYLTARYFGLRNYGTLFGCVISTLAISTAFGPITASMIRDSTGSYDLVLMLTIPAFLLSALAIATLPAYPRKPGDEPANA